MTDIADIADIEISRTIEAAIAARKQYAGDSAEYCADCDEPIPEARRKAVPGVRLCVECQGRTER